MTMNTRHFANGIVAMALVLLAAPMASAQENGAARGRRDYERYCVWCHGEYGDGHGPSHARFSPSPRDFTSATFKCRSTPSGSLPTDDDLRRTIRTGVHGT